MKKLSDKDKLAFSELVDKFFNPEEILKEMYRKHALSLDELHMYTSLKPGNDTYIKNNKII